MSGPVRRAGVPLQVAAHVGSVNTASPRKCSKPFRAGPTCPTKPGPKPALTGSDHANRRDEACRAETMRSLRAFPESRAHRPVPGPNRQPLLAAQHDLNSFTSQDRCASTGPLPDAALMARVPTPSRQPRRNWTCGKSCKITSDKIQPLLTRLAAQRWWLVHIASLMFRAPDRRSYIRNRGRRFSMPIPLIPGIRRRLENP